MFFICFFFNFIRFIIIIILNRLRMMLVFYLTLINNRLINFLWDIFIFFGMIRHINLILFHNLIDRSMTIFQIRLNKLNFISFKNFNFNFLFGISFSNFIFLYLIPNRFPYYSLFINNKCIKLLFMYFNLIIFKILKDIINIFDSLILNNIFLYFLISLIIFLFFSCFDLLISYYLTIYS
jgi:hypothetical protein